MRSAFGSLFVGRPWQRWSSALLASLVLSACGPNIPARFVLERDVEAWSYRRYQRVLDVEFAIEGNAAVGHTATYVRRPGRGSRSVAYVTAFVTAYEQAPGLAAEVRRQVRGLSTYEMEVRDFGGGQVFWLDGGAGDRWALWVSANHVIKIGASREMDAPPEELVESYMSIYESDLDGFGRAREGASSGGEMPSVSSTGDDDGVDTPEAESTPESMPSFLRQQSDEEEAAQ